MGKKIKAIKRIRGIYFSIGVFFLLIGITISISNYSIPSVEYIITHRYIVSNIHTEPYEMTVWVPLPVNTPFQSINDIVVRSNGDIETDIPFEKSVFDGVQYIELAVIQLEPFEDMDLYIRYTAHVNITREEHGIIEASYIQDDLFSVYTSPSDKIESDHPVIANAALQAIAGARNDRERVEALYYYITGYMQFEPEDFENMSAYSAFERQKAGISGFTRLFTAMARSIGIPTRIIKGGVITNPVPIFRIKAEPWGSPFQKHMWAEVYIDDSWLPVDLGTRDLGRIIDNRDPYQVEFAVEEVANKVFLYLVDTAKSVGKIVGAIPGWGGYLVAFEKGAQTEHISFVPYKDVRIMINRNIFMIGIVWIVGLVFMKWSFSLITGDRNL